MQFNLPYVDVTKTAFVKLISADGFLRYNGQGVHSCETRPPNMGYGYDFIGNDDKLIIIEIEIDGKIFNSINDNLMMVKGVKHETIMISDLIKYNKFCNQLRFNNDDYFFQPCRCEVNGVGVMYRIITKQNKDNIQYVSKTEYKDRIVEKEIIVEKEVIVYKEMENVVYKPVEELEECPICMEDKAIISFSCCNIKYCHKCSNKLKKCGQCRKNVDLDKVRQCI